MNDPIPEKETEAQMIERPKEEKYPWKALDAVRTFAVVYRTSFAKAKLDLSSRSISARRCWCSMMANLSRALKIRFLSKKIRLRLKATKASTER
jgi:hypothetical protein